MTNNKPNMVKHQTRKTPNPQNGDQITAPKTEPWWPTTNLIWWWLIYSRMHVREQVVQIPFITWHVVLLHPRKPALTNMECQRKILFLVFSLCFLKGALRVLKSPFETKTRRSNYKVVYLEVWLGFCIRWSVVVLGWNNKWPERVFFGFKKGAPGHLLKLQQKRWF